MSLGVPVWRVIRSLPGAASFMWNATRGARLRPWRSPYVRWRLETYTGIPAHQITLRDIIGLLYRERAQMLRFLRWTGEIRLKSDGVV